jgi:hypothetical protein
MLTRCQPMFGPLAISPRPSDGLAAQRKECVNAAVPTVAFAIAYGPQTQRERPDSNSVFTILPIFSVLFNIALMARRSPAEAQIPLVVRRRQPPHRELYLAVGKLAPVFDDRHLAADRVFVEDVARFCAG